jgi:DNA polymerase III alpha subunit
MFTELCATSNFTFLTGGSHPEEYVAQAAGFGMPAIAIADENSVAGIVRAHVQAREEAPHAGRSAEPGASATPTERSAR